MTAAIISIQFAETAYVLDEIGSSIKITDREGFIHGEIALACFSPIEDNHNFSSAVELALKSGEHQAFNKLIVGGKPCSTFPTLEGIEIQRYPSDEQFQRYLKVQAINPLTQQPIFVRVRYKNLKHSVR